LHYAINPIETSEADTVRYVIDAKDSKFTVRATAAGMLSAFAHSPLISIPDFEGEVRLNLAVLENSSLRMVIHSASLVATDVSSDKDREEINRRMHDEVLESDGFAEIVYECSRVSASKTGEAQYWAALQGELSLHGVTRNQVVSARVSVNGDSLRATGEFFIRQSDYEIKPVTAAGGAIRLKDELKFSFDISARKPG